MRAEEISARLRRKSIARGLKRLLDIVAGVLGLVALAPVLALTAALIRLTLGSPVFFRQTRPGLNGRPFSVWKFRTMTDAKSADGTLLPDAQRLTPIGRLLRRFNLDELPQLLNIVAGEMSLVGPRPLLMQYLDRYTERQRLRLLVKPGLTGWAQVHGRKALDWQTRLELDAWYVENWSLWLDLKVLALTFRPGTLRGDAEDSGEFFG